MEKGFKPNGWLGLLLGTRMYYPFYPAAIDTDAGFAKSIDAVLREVGDRGKPKRNAARVPEGVPPAPAPAPLARTLSPAPAPTRSTYHFIVAATSLSTLSSPALGE